MTVAVDGRFVRVDCCLQKLSSGWTQAYGQILVAGWPALCGWTLNPELLYREGGEGGVVPGKTDNKQVGR